MYRRSWRGGRRVQRPVRCTLRCTCNVRYIRPVFAYKQFIPMNKGRNAFGMNIEAVLPHIGQIVLRDQPAVRVDLQRIVAMWSQQMEQHGNRLLFGDFSIADAYYAPVCMRLRTYALPVPAAVTAYADRVRALPGVKAWTEAALLEHDFVVFDEPYRVAR